MSDVVETELVPLDAEMAALEGDLRARFAVIDERVRLASTGREFAMLRPRSADELISEAEFNQDERLPYWAEIWPSARVLAERIGTWPGAGKRLLELGGGCGYVAMAAGAAGFDVLATDYYEPACDFVRLNAARHGLLNVQAQMINWRDLPSDLQRYDVVLAADVLYEREYCELIASVITRTLADDGIAVVTDPGRQRAAAFLEECAKVGLAGTRVAQVPYNDGTLKPTVDVYELRWAKGKVA